MTAYYTSPLVANPAADKSNINSDFDWTFNQAISGWIDAVNPADGTQDTWTYVSATSFTISGVDRTAVYIPGTKIKLTQTTAKYFIVVSSVYSGGDTTVSVDGRGVYTIANAAITSPYFSYAYNPAGFLMWLIKSTGWINAYETWTYVSATSFTISGNLTTQYQAGDKLKLTQTTVKYFDIADLNYNGGTGLTTVTINGHGLFTLANAAITDNFYSKEASPEGFPGWNDGWIPFRTVLTYASATTFTIPGDYSSIFQRGDKIKFDQTTTKYFYVVSASYSAPNTTLTVTGGSDYSVANAAISNAFWSHSAAPYSFPDSFNYSPTFTGFSSNPSNTVSRFSIIGNKCFLSHAEGIAGTSDSTGFTITLPITAATISNQIWHNSADATDNSTHLTTPARVQISSAGTTAVIYKDFSGANWTNSGNKKAEFQIVYEI